MSNGFPFFRSTATDLDAIHRTWGWLLAWGVLLVVAGIAALAYPVAATVASVQVFGVLMLFAAGGQFLAAFYSRGWGGVLMAVLCGLLYLLGGVLLLERPLLAATGYTLFLTVLFFAVGAVRVTTAIIHRFSGWGWAVLSGAVSIVLAVLVWQNLPEAALWVIGTFVGIDLLFAGWSWVMLGLAARRLPSLAVAPAQ